MAILAHTEDGERHLSPAIRFIFRLFNLGGPGSDEIAQKIKDVIASQWKDEIVIEGSGTEESADYDIAIFFGYEFTKPMGVLKGNTKTIYEDSLPVLIEKCIKAAFDVRVAKRAQRNKEARLTDGTAFC